MNFQRKFTVNPTLLSLIEIFTTELIKQPSMVYCRSKWYWLTTIGSPHSLLQPNKICKITHCHHYPHRSTTKTPLSPHSQSTWLVLDQRASIDISLSNSQERQ